MEKKTLWVKNNTSADVSLSDLGVKVAANQTTNIYAYNPYITEQQVQASLESGSLQKRLKNNVLSLAKGFKPKRPHTLDHIKTSNKAIEISKSKSAVYVNTKDEDVLSDSDFGEIADYGLGDLGHENTSNVKTNDGSIVVEQKKDPSQDQDQHLVLKPTVRDSDVTKNVSSIIMEDPASEVTATDDVVVADIPKPDTEPAEEKPDHTPMAEKVDDTIVVNKPEDVEKTDENESYDMQVATKDDSGVTVMKVKEVKKTAKKSKKATKKRKKKTTK